MILLNNVYLSCGDRIMLTTINKDDVDYDKECKHPGEFIVISIDRNGGEIKLKPSGYHND